MTTVLVTGRSGTGKSTALAELARRGHRVVDTDYGDWIDVLVGRVISRRTNDYGKTDAERALILHDLRTVEPLLRAGATAEIDTRTPVDDVADRLEAIAGRCG
jgi:adenylate kinase family enzyme